jgi:hypothetical protein
VSNPWGFVKIRLTGPDGEVETPWAEPVGEYFRLDNLPWFAYGVSDDDIVEATPTDSDGLFDFVRVHVPSGNRLVRIIFDPPDASQPVLDQVKAMGCHYEGVDGSYVAISIPPDVDLGSVTSYLVTTGHNWEHANPTYDELHPGS